MAASTVLDVSGRVPACEPPHTGRLRRPIRNEPALISIRRSFGDQAARRATFPLAYKLKCTSSQVVLEVGSAALRYYDRAGLLPNPARTSNRRQYDRGVLGRLRIILLARDAGFSISEN